MLVPVLAAFVAAAPAVVAQTQSPTFTRCTTRWGSVPLPSTSSVPETFYKYPTTTITVVVDSTSQDTITVTPAATTATFIVTETTLVTTTTTSTPGTTTFATGAGYKPLLLISEPTGTSRIKRLQLEVEDSILRRQDQTPPGNTGGWVLRPNGTEESLDRVHPRRVECEVRMTTTTTSTRVVTAAPTTTTVPQSTVTAISTSTVTSTTTITEVLPTPTAFAACRSNNVVNSLEDRDGNRMYFDRVVYSPPQGFPIASEMTSNTTSAQSCCNSCHGMRNCAGYFYNPGKSQCHIRLTEVPPPANGTIPATPAPTGPPTYSCPQGSDTLYLGKIRGKSADDFGNPQAAPSFGNGPCGRYSVDTRPVPAGQKMLLL